MPEDPDAAGNAREMRQHRLAQLVAYVVVHPKILRPRCLGSIQVEPGAGAEFPIVRLAGNAGLARTRVTGHQHQSVPCGEPLRTGLDREGLFGAGEAGEIEQHRHTLPQRLRWLIHPEAHRQADHRGLMAIEALQPLEAFVLADRFEHGSYGTNAAPWCGPTHYRIGPPARIRPLADA